MRYLIILPFFLLTQLLLAQCGVGELVSYDGDDHINNMPPACEDLAVIGSDMIFYGDDACTSGSWCGNNEFYHCDQDYSNNGNLENEPYIDFSLQPSGLDSLNITGINILMWSYMSGVNSGAHEGRVAVSLDDGVTWIDSSDFAIDLGTSCSENDQGTMISWTLDDPILTVEEVLFRIHLFGSNSSSNALYQTVLYEATVLGEILLPSEEANFHLEVKENRVELFWNTLEYIHTYELERAGEEGVFFPLMKFAENSESSMSYSDSSPARFNLYRLKLIDYSGNISYTVVQRAELSSFSGKDLYRLFPTIMSTDASITLSIPVLDEMTSYQIWTPTGKAIREGSLLPYLTNQAIKAPSETGYYFFVLENSERQVTMRFVVR